MPAISTQTPSHARWLKRLSYAAIAAACAFAFAAQAEGLGDRIEIHGYGHVGYFRSSKLDYAESTQYGNWDGLTSLLFVAPINEQSKVWVQLHNTSEKSHLDWAYVDFKLSPETTARAGQIKLPLGLYTETIDASFLRPSTVLPLIYQDAANFVQENFRGADIAHTFDFGAQALTLKAYSGQIVNDAGQDAEVHQRLTGIQASYATPIDGLRLVGSVYQSHLAIHDVNRRSGLGNQTTSILSLDYVSDRWDAKAEVANTDLLGVKSQGAYVQVARTFADRWIPFVRIDHMTVYRDSPQEHAQTSISAGVSYKVNDQVSLRFEEHYNRGDALPYAEWLASSPGTPLDATMAPQAKSWNNYALSINFIF